MRMRPSAYHMDIGTLLNQSNKYQNQAVQLGKYRKGSNNARRSSLSAPVARPRQHARQAGQIVKNRQPQTGAMLSSPK